MRLPNLFVGLGVLGLVVVGCAAPPAATFGEDNLTGDEKNNDPNPSKPDDAKGATEPGANDAAPTCNDQCADGQKRCADASTAGTEVCVKAADGCLRWTQSADCAVDYTCDKTKNDGTCVAGCTNDV